MMASASPHILGRQETPLSAWTTLMSRTLHMPGQVAPAEYHSLIQADYVTAIGVTASGQIPLVRQYRPALERFTLELPGGLRDGEEDPQTAALREFTEETGLSVIGPAHALGCLVPDSGRLENKLWGFVVKANEQAPAQWASEPGIERLMVPRATLRAWIMDGTFDNALHIALLGLAVMHNFFQWE